MNAALPVDHELNRPGVGVDVGQDFLDQGSEDTLLETNVGVGVVPKLLYPTG
jgi:hypothetical protein